MLVMQERDDVTLSDEQWAAVEPHIPKSTARTGRPAADRRLMLEAVFDKLAGVLPLEADRQNLVDRSALMADGTSVRASACAAGGRRRKRGRRRRSTATSTGGATSLSGGSAA